MATRSDLQEAVRSQKCRRCGKAEPAMIRYKGFFMGWFCNDHRPDRIQAKNAGEMIQIAYEVDQPPKPGVREVYPIAMNEKDHPFHEICMFRISKGIGCWDMIVTTFMPKVRSTNRAERRRR